MTLPTNIENLLSPSAFEGTRIELKKGWNPITIMRTVCAFANDFENVGSGYIIVGTEEVDGRAVRPVLGFDPTKFERVQQELIRYSNLIKPTYIPRVFLEEVDGKHVLVIWVPADSARPYKVPDDVTAKNKKYNYRIRQLSSSVIPSPEQERELLELNAKIPFDDRTNTHYKIDELNFASMREHLSEAKSKLYENSASMSTKELAFQMNLCDGGHEHLFPKNIGLLMFANDPQKYFPDIRIEIAEYPEGKGSKTFTEKVITGSIQMQLRDALSYLKTNVIKSKTIKHSNTEVADKIFNYPYSALEEALANAVYHRNYEIREPIEVQVLPESIEIISYSGVDPSVKQKDLDDNKVRARRYRNRRIGDFLKELGLTEGRGTGVPLMYSEMEENGSESPKFDTDEPDRRYFIVTLPIHKEFISSGTIGGTIGGAMGGAMGGAIGGAITESQEKVLKLIIENNKTSYRAIASKLDINESAILKHIKKLKENGVIERKGGTRGYWEVKKNGTK